ncbi:DEAD-domain-containing protein [Backusella circina FSU 941]|nr:DEAD-domain-containing protein [Backusella circina FSU 941]
MENIAQEQAEEISNFSNNSNNNHYGLVPSILKRKHPEKWHSFNVKKQKTQHEEEPKSDQLANKAATLDQESNEAVTFNQEPDSTQIVIKEEEPKLFSSLQRIAQADEPICIICGKYGEYINNDTEHDICSIECKRIDIERYRTYKNKKPADTSIIIKQTTLADNLHAKLTNYIQPKVYMDKEKRELMYKAHEMQVTGDKIPNPIHDFAQLHETLSEALLTNIHSELNWNSATAVQRAAIPACLAGRDVYGIAPTHNGKTGAFLIPIIAHCQSLNQHLDYKRRAGPFAIIMAPTRELCIQIEAIAKKLMKGLRNMRTALLIGGEPIPTQLYRLKKGAQVVIATPGRLLEIANCHMPLLRVWKVHMLVLDEVDAMFSLGFENQIKQILGKFNNHHHNPLVRQTLFFSATEHPKVTSLLHRHLKHPIKISVEQRTQDIPHANDAIRHTVLWVPNESKSKQLFSILKNPTYAPLTPILVFVASRLGAEFLSRAISKKRPELRVVAMHADKPQDERSSVVQSIHEYDVVVTTDILARGIDLPNVKLVINYDMTATLQEYVHRVGRAVLQKPTNKQRLGWAITFINKENQALLEGFAKMLSSKSVAQVTPLPFQLKKLL